MPLKPVAARSCAVHMMQPSSMTSEHVSHPSISVHVVDPMQQCCTQLDMQICTFIATLLFAQHQLLHWEAVSQSTAAGGLPFDSWQLLVFHLAKRANPIRICEICSGLRAASDFTHFGTMYVALVGVRCGSQMRSGAAEVQCYSWFCLRLNCFVSTWLPLTPPSHGQRESKAWGSRDTGIRTRISTASVFCSIRCLDEPPACKLPQIACAFSYVDHTYYLHGSPAVPYLARKLERERE